jgi:hypothetical protein
VELAQKEAYQKVQNKQFDADEKTVKDIAIKAQGSTQPRLLKLFLWFLLN